MHKKMVRIYQDLGVSQLCFNHTSWMFANLPKSRHLFKISSINAKELRNDSFLDKTDVLVIPGGADIPYCHLINGKGTTQILNFIARGGRLLAICAGAYFASKIVEFSIGDPKLEVKGIRQLGLFSGTAKGPIYPGYDYKSYKHARAVKIKAFGKEHQVFYFGGCFFQGALKNSEQLLGVYGESDHLNTKAIIYGKFGLGSYALSGVHFEFSPQRLKDAEDIYLRKIGEQLIDSEDSIELLQEQILACLMQGRKEAFTSASL